MSAPRIKLPEGAVTRVMVLLADGVSLTTVSATLEPFQQANTLLEQE